MSLRTIARPVVAHPARFVRTFASYTSASASLGASTASSSRLYPLSRAFSSSPTRHYQAAKPHNASTALKENVKHKEEERDVPVVGDEVRGAEGPHYEDKMMGENLSIIQNQGQWTLFQPIYTKQDLDAVQVVGRTPITISDKLAHGAVKLMRGTFDLLAGYKHYQVPAETLAMKPIPVEQLRAEGKILTVKQWLARIILLESFAGCPGMVAGTLRHLRSLRLLRRDGGWIHTMLEEAENERMHLLTFMTIAQPTWFLRLLCLGAQGVMYNILFLSYLVSPKTVHRFVGALEEEATRTYTHCISDLEQGLIPEWENQPAPKIAIDYWRMPSDATLLDVIKAVRADEATHRFVNHSLANLDQKRDFNPFALGEPSPAIRATVPEYTRQQSAEFAKRAQEALMRGEKMGH